MDIQIRRVTMTPEQRERLEQYRTVQEPYYTKLAKDRRRMNGTAAECGIPPFNGQVLKPSEEYPR